MGFYLYSIRFSFKTLLKFSLFCLPLAYYRRENQRCKVMQHIRDKDEYKQLQLSQAQNEFKNFEADRLYKMIKTNENVHISDLPGTYKLIVLGDPLLFKNLKQSLQAKYYLIIDSNDTQLIENCSQWKNTMVGEDIKQQFYLLNDQSEVLLQDQLSGISQASLPRLTSLMKIRINRDIEMKLIKQMKF